MSKTSDQYKTDLWIQELVGSAYDPCPFNPYWNPDEHINGLLTDWVHESYEHNGRIFVNPPYSNPSAWVDKSIEAWQEGCTVFLLLRHDSSTDWYRRLHEVGAHMMMINKRLKHQTGRSANFASVLFVLSAWREF